MSCTSSNIWAMLMPYIDKVLARQNKREVEDHLRACQSCREEVRRLSEGAACLQELARYGYKPSFEAHPAKDLLFSYTLEDGSLPDNICYDIHLHLLMCPRCRAEKEIIAKADADFRSRVIADSSQGLPPILREAFNRRSPLGQVIGAEPEEPPTASEHFWALGHKFNLRFAASVILALILGGACLYFAFSGSSADMPGDVPLATASVSGASSALVPLDVASGNLAAACEALDRAKIPYENENGHIMVASDKAEAAKRAINADNINTGDDSNSSSAPSYEEIPPEDVNALPDDNQTSSASVPDAYQEPESASEPEAQQESDSFSEPEPEASQDSSASEETGESSFSQPVVTKPRVKKVYNSSGSSAGQSSHPSAPAAPSEPKQAAPEHKPAAHEAVKPAPAPAAPAPSEVMVPQAAEPASSSPKIKPVQRPTSVKAESYDAPAPEPAPVIEAAPVPTSAPEPPAPEPEPVSVPVTDEAVPET